MKTEKKIFLNKNEGLDVAVHRLINTKSHIVILNIPRESVLTSSINNFHVLKRESMTAGKELHVESIDEIVLELAALAKIKAFNPVFKQRERIISDILPRPKFKVTPKKMQEDEDEKEIAASKGGEPLASLDASRSGRPEDSSGREEESEDGEEAAELENIIPPAEIRQVFRRSKKRRLFRTTFYFAAVILVVGGGFFIANRVLPKATVEMILKKVPVTFAYGVKATTDYQVAGVKEGRIMLPAELLKAKGNLSLSFPASGREKVERRAEGTLTVYNAYSSDSQVLVATTRFLSPSGKLFRLDKRVTIPGAKIENGKIVPSEIEVKVTADEAGEDYNVGPEEYWRIPGFKGGPRYEGFYADSRGAMSGGLVGEETVPTKEDIEKGKVKLFSDLESILEAQVLILLSEKFKVFPGARGFEILDEQVEMVRDDGNFGIFAEAELRYLVFEEKTLEETVVSDAGKAAFSDMRVREFSIDYGEPEINLNESSVNFSVEGEVVFEPDLDVEKLKQEFAGQNEEELRKTVFFLSGLERANISLWPFWVNKVPGDPDKVKIILN